MTDAWFEVQHFPHGITMIREPHQSEDVKSYLVEGERDVAIIDTGTGAGDFPGLVASLSSKRPRVLQSHGHWDHAGHSHAYDEVLIHPTEVEWLRGGFPAQRYIAAFSPGQADVEFIPAGFDPSGGMRGTEATGTIEHGDLIDLGNPRTRFMFNFGAGGSAAIFRRGLARNLVLESAVRTDGSLADTVVLTPAEGEMRLMPPEMGTLHGRLDVQGADYMAERLGAVSLANFVGVISEAVERSGHALSDLRFLGITHMKASFFREILAAVGLTPDQARDEASYRVMDRLAGLAGAVEVAGRTGYVTLDMSPGYGMSGVVIAMLAMLNPLAVVAAAIFVAGMLVGADSMSRAVAVPTYIADVIVAIALICMLVATLLTQYRIRR